MQAANKRKKTAIVIAMVIAATWCVLLISAAVQAATPHPMTTGQQAPATVAAPGQPETQQMLGWLAMMFGIGEVAGAVGMGISHIRRNKRQEREEQTLRFTPDNARLLRYEDHLAMLQADVA